MTTLDFVTELVCSLDSDLLGIAWLIAQRSPHLTAKQIERAAQMELKRETFGRIGRKSAKTVCRRRETFDERRHNRADQRGDDAARLAEITAFGERISSELGELGGLLAEGWHVNEAAELAEVSRETAFRKLRAVRQQHAAEFLNILAE
jgi:predicted DNA-binding protein (UPF0251 family)